MLSMFSVTKLSSVAILVAAFHLIIGVTKWIIVQIKVTKVTAMLSPLKVNMSMKIFNYLLL